MNVTFAKFKTKRRSFKETESFRTGSEDIMKVVAHVSDWRGMSAHYNAHAAHAETSASEGRHNGVDIVKVQPCYCCN